MTKKLDVLIPTYNRQTALSVTLTSLISQSYQDFRVVVSDQTDAVDVRDLPEIKEISYVLNAHQIPIIFKKHLPRLGMAEQRQFLLDQANAPFVLFLDDDLILENYVLNNMIKAIEEEECGFVGSAVIGLSYINDVRPWEQGIQIWETRVEPEDIKPDTPEWNRKLLHNAANLYHVQTRLGLTPENQKKYHVAWVGGCTLFDTQKLQNVGGFTFWKELPEKHSGEDVLVQNRVMRHYGGCGLIPSGVYHQELPTTIPDREYDAPFVLPLEGDEDEVQISQRQQG